MPTFSNKVAIGICDRCCFKYKNSVLRADPNYHGLRVCPDCIDEKNPYLLPPLRPDNIALKYPRPDTPLYPFANPSQVFPVTYPQFWDEAGATWDEPGATWVP